MNNNAETLYQMALSRIQSLTNPSETKIEEEIRQIAELPYFESINEETILTIPSVICSSSTL